MSDEINMHISRLKSSRVSPVIAKISIKYFSTNIERVKDIDDFYTIDYEKYGEQIIKNSNISDDIKEEIRNRFTNNVVTNGNQNTNIRRPRADTTIARSQPILGAPRQYVPKQQSNSEPALGAPRQCVPKQQSDGEPALGASKEHDDSYMTALTKESSDKNDDFAKGIAVRRNFRRNSTYVRRLPSQILLFA